ncbi:DNA repair protein RecO [Allosphingosinicella flava]|uniref:DNA repair protein RecO n=1 Tax=Allosphingosinicella flava TaxID=2771430 RepID=A0A7T2GLJ2_9SPHN|nr:DNA repair protein RecO [Sphingosinicella flava]QPQ55997.1 DNA repair protein RecO [Sphingosinicella flava]
MDEFSRAPDAAQRWLKSVHLATTAIVLSLRPHGEHGTIARFLTPEAGVQAGYVRGGRSRRLKPVLVPGNIVQAEYRARTDEQLAQLAVELVASRAPLFSEALPAAAIEWAATLTATALPEGQPYPRLYQALDGLLAAIEAAPSAKGWAAAFVRYELLLLSELGFGLDLSECAATGARDGLAFVSPKSGRAVSREGAGAYRDRLLPLPPFLVGGGEGGWDAILDGFRLTGHFLARDVLIDRQAEALAARDRLIDRLRRVVR